MADKNARLSTADYLCLQPNLWRGLVTERFSWGRIGAVLRLSTPGLPDTARGPNV